MGLSAYLSNQLTFQRLLLKRLEPWIEHAPIAAFCRMFASYSLGKEFKPSLSFILEHVLDSLNPQDIELLVCRLMLVRYCVQPPFPVY